MRPHRAQLRRSELALERAKAAGRIRSHWLQQAPVLRLLHQLGKGLARLDSDFSQDRRHVVQVGLRYRYESLSASWIERNALRRGYCQWPAQLHERIRR